MKRDQILAEYTTVLLRYGVDSDEERQFAQDYAWDEELSALIAISRRLKKALNENRRFDRHS
jgi:hypothetical protein